MKAIDFLALKFVRLALMAILFTAGCFGGGDQQQEENLEVSGESDAAAPEDEALDSDEMETSDEQLPSDALSADAEATETDSLAQEPGFGSQDSADASLSDTASPDLMNSDTIAANDKAPTYDIHIVQKGDWLSKLAGRYYGDVLKWNIIADANPQITNPHLIYPGMELKIPRVGSTMSQNSDDSLLKSNDDLHGFVSPEASHILNDTLNLDTPSQLAHNVSSLDYQGLNQIGVLMVVYGEVRSAAVI